MVFQSPLSDSLRYPVGELLIVVAWVAGDDALRFALLPEFARLPLVVEILEESLEHVRVGQLPKCLTGRAKLHVVIRGRCCRAKQAVLHLAHKPRDELSRLAIE